MSLYNIITQTQTQSRSLSGGFGGEKGLKDFFFDGFGDTIAVVFYFENYLPVFFFG